MTEKLKIKDIVQDGNVAYFNYLRGAYAYFFVHVNGVDYRFPIELSDLDGADLYAQEKAITLMRYIRKALEDNTFVVL